MPIKRLDEVSIFSHKLTFLIPHEWIEVESNENDIYLYHFAKCDIRVLSSLVNHRPWPSAEAKDEFPQKPGKIEVNTTTGNFIVRSEKVSTHHGMQIHICRKNHWTTRCRCPF